MFEDNIPEFETTSYILDSSEANSSHIEEGVPNFVITSSSVRKHKAQVRYSTSTGAVNESKECIISSIQGLILAKIKVRNKKALEKNRIKLKNSNDIENKKLRNHHQ